VDPLFRSAAWAYGPRVVGVVLSGTLDDGTAGLLAIKQQGGIAIVQDPQESLYPSMPRSALEAVAVDHVLPVAGIADLLDRLARVPVKTSRGAGPVTDEIQRESQVAAFNLDVIEDEDRPGQLSAFGCPDCGGTLWELQDGELVRFRCRVGHAWTANGLLAEQAEGVETALWTALRALEERAVLCRRIANRMARRGLDSSADRFRQYSADSRQRAAILRQVLVSQPTTNDEPAPAAMEDNGEDRHGGGNPDG
jgi:two-component system chemotaxis response regulator CheB